MPAGSSQPSMLLWDGKKATTGRAICVDQLYYAAPKIDHSLRLSLRLPPGYATYLSTQDLFAAVSKVFEIHCGQRADTAQLLAYFVFASHVIESLNIAPCVLLEGSASSEAVRILRILSALCRHSVPLVGLTVEGLAALPKTLRPTIILLAPEQAQLAETLIRASSQCGFGVLKKNGLHNFFFAKAVYIGTERLSRSSGDGSLRIVVTPAREPILWEEKQEEKLAAELQPKLLAYRLTNLQNVAESTFDVPNFTGSARDLARSLGASIVGDSELQARLIPLLRPQDQAVRVARTTELSSLIAEALLILCHEPGTGRVHVGEITTLVNGIRNGRGESAVSQPREVGARLKTFGLFSHRDAKGYSFQLSNDAKKRIHDFALALEVPAMQKGFPGCQFCPTQAANQEL